MSKRFSDPPSKRNLWVIFEEDKQPKSENLSSAEVKNAWGFTILLLQVSMDWCFV
jgi:hypothetical protein